MTDKIKGIENCGCICCRRAARDVSTTSTPQVVQDNVRLHQENETLLEYFDRIEVIIKCYKAHKKHG